MLSAGMRIEINIPPVQSWLPMLIVGGVVWVVASGGDNESPDPVGGSRPAALIEQDLRDMRREQSVLDRREEILRNELEVLQMLESRGQGDPQQLEAARQRLLSLMQDKQQAERSLLSALEELWAAQEDAEAISMRSIAGAAPVQWTWPVEPDLGISAYFQDDGYEERFGIPHHAIDIPVAQGSPIRAAADGIVEKVSDRGLGFSSIIIRHGGGVATLYGHVSGFRAEEGQRVRAGQTIAVSGGTPGTPGAGHLTTGPHLHFQMLQDGQPVDPLKVLRE